MDFMNLNQSAHGDREFGVHRDAAWACAGRRSSATGSDPAVAARIGVWARAAARLARGAAAPGRALRRQHARGRGHRGRQGRGADPARRLRQRLRRRRPRRRGRGASPTPRSTRSSRSTRTTYDARAGAARRRRAARVAARRRADRGRAARRSSSAGGFGAFTDTFEDLARPRRSCPGIAVQRLMADGYGFGAEGDWKTAALVRIVEGDGSGLAGGTSFMEDYTYDLAPGGADGARRAHARGLPVDRRGTAVVRDPPALDRRQGRPGAARLHGRARARRSSPRCSTSATASGSSLNEVERRAAAGADCRGCRWRGRCGSRSPTSPPPPRRGCAPAARTTPSSAAAIGTEAFARPRRDRRDRAARDRRARPGSATSRTSCAGTRRTTGSPEGLVSAARTSCASACSRRTWRSGAPGSSSSPSATRAPSTATQASWRSSRAASPTTELTRRRDRRRRPRERRGRRRRDAAVVGHADPPRPLPRAARASAASCTRTRRSPPPGRRRGARSPATGRRTPTTSTAPCPVTRPLTAAEIDGEYERATGEVIVETFAAPRARAARACRPCSSPRTGRSRGAPRSRRRSRTRSRSRRSRRARSARCALRPMLAPIGDGPAPAALPPQARARAPTTARPA